MGLKILDNSLIPEIDVSLANCIITFGGKYSVVKMYGHQALNSVLRYKLSSSYTVWASERAYQAGPNSDFKPIIQAQPFCVDISESQLGENLIELLYSKLKEKYPNSVDC